MKTVLMMAGLPLGFPAGNAWKEAVHAHSFVFGGGGGSRDDMVCSFQKGVFVIS